MAQFFAATPVGEFVQHGNSIPILIKSDETIEQKQKLLDKRIMTVNGEKKLSSYISLEMVDSHLQIDRSNGERYMSIIADTETQDLSTVHREINKVIRDMDVNQGY